MVKNKLKNLRIYFLLPVAVLAFIFLLALPAKAQLKVPDHAGVWVHDEAGVLSAQTKSQLEAYLKAERDSTSNQIAVLIVPSLEGEDISAWGIRVADAWKIGTKENDNGVLLLVAIKDKRVRIEVGQGLEGVLTDALSSRINRNEIAPRFRQGDYEGGVIAGVIAIKKAIKGQYVNTDPPQRKHGGRSPWVTIVVIILLLIFASRKGGGGMGGYWAAGMLMGGLGKRNSGGSDRDYGGGGSFGGGGSSDSW
ncbi:MAG: TPM domain-containing protein [Bacteroidetes bacterium]|nr:TPM domain-containing protein [Bacteroidota bacterium]MBS1539094.1 TPM domain-containing protein [Bacteroidota bacterium]